jgi:hypothetical protein
MNQKRNAAFAILLFLHVSHIGVAQTSNKTLVIHSIAGFNAPQLSNLNTVLANEGLPQFKEFYFTRGGGFYAIFPKARLASLFNFSTHSGTKTSGEQGNWLRSTQVGTSLGFVATKNEKLQVIPFAGLNYSFFGARVSADNVSNRSFTNYFGAAANQYHVSSNQFMGNFGLQISKVGIGDKRLLQKIVVGLRAGYFLPLGDSKWKSNNETLTNGPTINPGGMYATFLLGLQQ